MKKITILLVCAVLAGVCSAETKEQRAANRHEVRLGIGDPFFEMTVYNNSPSHNYAAGTEIPTDFVTTDKSDYRYTGHLFAEYQFRVNSWFGVGFMADFEGMLWNETTYNHKFEVLNFESCRSYNFALLPTVRFTYFHHELANLYSAASLGMNVAFDNLQNRVCSWAFNVTLLGAQVGNEHWFGFAELGLLNALNHKSQIFMVGSRLVSAGFGYRF